MEQTRAVQAFSALAHDTRLEIVRLLVPCGAAGLPAGALGARLGVAAPALSFHLGTLEAAGLIGSRREGRKVIYHADCAMLGRVVGYLLDDCCGGDAWISSCTRG